jgi:hypothetical protein
VTNELTLQGALEERSLAFVLAFVLVFLHFFIPFLYFFVPSGYL